MAGLAALVLVTLDPNVLAHSALVTTDVGVSLFFLASIYAFYRYVKQPTMARLALAGLVAGLLLATKHSGILLAPILLMLIVWEVMSTPRKTRDKPASAGRSLRGDRGHRHHGAVGVLRVPLCGAACRVGAESISR